MIIVRRMTILQEVHKQERKISRKSKERVEARAVFSHQCFVQAVEGELASRRVSEMHKAECMTGEYIHLCQAVEKLLCISPFSNLGALLFFILPLAPDSLLSLPLSSMAHSLSFLTRSLTHSLTPCRLQQLMKCSMRTNDKYLSMS